MPNVSLFQCFFNVIFEFFELVGTVAGRTWCISEFSSFTHWNTIRMEWIKNPIWRLLVMTIVETDK
jgi:hypothetical protein